MNEPVLSIPELSLVVLVGVSGSGKSTFARQRFKPMQVVSSDACRALVADDETDQSATKDAFDLVHYIAAKRLASGRLTVIDATNVQTEARKPLVKLARDYHSVPVAIVLHVPEKLCGERNAQRPERPFGREVIARQTRQLNKSVKHLKREGFRVIHHLRDEDAIAQATIQLEPLWCNRKTDRGPFDIIGDVHGCFDELHKLLRRLGYEITERDGSWEVTHPEDRRVVFLGDLVDRGPRIPEVLRLVMWMCESGMALCVPGNHDLKLLRYLRGKRVNIAHGLQASIDQLANEPVEFREQVASFIDSLVSHYVLDDGKLVVAHAGMRAEYQGRASRKVRDFALFGETTGETDEFGLPVRYDWARDYRGRAQVVYGHTPVPEPDWLNRTINIDTGCVFGGQLTALRYPENERVSEPSAREYCEPIRPLNHPPDDAGLVASLPDIQDVLGKRAIETGLRGRLTIRKPNAAAALELISRFAVDPHWLIYLPPTMSPSETSKRDGWLERPEEAFAYYQRRGITEVICQEKHMGSRAIVVVCKDSETAERRFGGENGQVERAGICYTRTGRPFFQDSYMEYALLDAVRHAMTRADLWNRMNTSWVCFDCELMPWSAKARDLILEQYAATGLAAEAGLNASVEALKSAGSRVESLESEARAELERLESEQQTRLVQARLYQAAYQPYCWPVETPNDLRLAPFHLLVEQHAVHTDKPHTWHIEQIEALCQVGNGILTQTPYKIVRLNSEHEVDEAVQWWEHRTANGSEGMVVKPMPFIPRKGNELLQPALKCRGREYLRIIYGPEYTRPEYLQRLKQRHLHTKRSLALREFALGVEGLERFVRNEPLHRVHECVFGVLALESEPVDPRL